MDYCEVHRAFHQIYLDPKTRLLTFIKPGGLYEWMTAPLGLSSAPAEFQSTCKNVRELNILSIWKTVRLIKR